MSIMKIKPSMINEVGKEIDDLSIISSQLISSIGVNNGGDLNLDIALEWQRRILELRQAFIAIRGFYLGSNIEGLFDKYSK